MALVQRLPGWPFEAGGDVRPREMTVTRAFGRGNRIRLTRPLAPLLELHARGTFDGNGVSNHKFLWYDVHRADARNRPYERCLAPDPHDMWGLDFISTLDLVLGTLTDSGIPSILAIVGAGTRAALRSATRTVVFRNPRHSSTLDRTSRVTTGPSTARALIRWSSG